MPKWKYVYLENDKSLSGDSGTYVVDLPKNGYLSVLTIKYKDTRPAFTTAVLPRFHAVTKLEILNGSRVIQSLSGRQCQAMAYYRGNRYGYNMRIDRSSQSDGEYFYMHLGLTNQDPLHMLHLNRLESPQFRITWDGTATSIKGHTYDAGSSISPIITVMATICDKPPAGFTDHYVKTSETHTYTQATSTTEYVDIARDQPLLGIAIEGGYKGKTILDDFAKVRLNIDSEDWVPFQFEDYEMLQMQVEWFGQIQNNFKSSVIDAMTLETGLGDVLSDSLMNISGNSARAFVWTQSGGDVKIGLSLPCTGCKVVSQQTLIKLRFGGILPHQIIYFPMDKCILNGLPYLDVRQFRQVTLELTSGASASTSSRPKVIVEYLEPNSVHGAPVA